MKSSIPQLMYFWSRYFNTFTTQ